MKHAILPAALLCLLLGASPAFCLERIALIIGNNYGLAEDAPLRFATEDAKSLHAALTELGGIEKGRSYLLLNPGKAKVLATFQEILGRTKEIRGRGARAMIFAYYSGHGDPASFHLGGESLTLDEVRAFFSQVEADVKVLVADACYSGALISAKGAKPGDPLPLDFTQETDARGSVILTSSSASELSRESRELQGSVFTHYFVSGLRGAADRDRDARVSLQEAYEYARIQLARSPGGRAASPDPSQTPQYDFDLRGSAPLILSELDRGTARLRLDGLIPGEYAVFGERRRAVASVRVGPGDTVLFALPKAPYLVRRSAARKVYLAEADLNWSRLAVLTPGDFTAYPVDILNAKGSLPLGRNPWKAFAEQEAVASFPDAGVRMMLASLGLEYRWEDWSLGISAGFVFPHSLSGPGLRLRRDGYGLGAEGCYSLFERSRYLLFTGISGRYWNLAQTATRTGEGAIRQAGYAAVPSQRGDAWGAAGVLGAELRLPLRLAVSLQARPGLITWNSPDGSLDHAWRTSAGLSAGYRF